MITLCRQCNERFGSFFSEGECVICGGAMEKVPLLAENGAKLIPGDWDSFSISTSIPKEMLIAEEGAFDYCLGEGIKSALNHVLSEMVSELSGKPYSPAEGSGRLVFDMRSLTVSAVGELLFIFGRYRKLAAGISQSRWDCRKCGGRGCPHCEGKGRMYESVEEIISAPLEKRTGGKAVLHASGREDVDVKNSAGRPFVLGISGVEKRKPDLEAAEGEIREDGRVEVSDLRFVHRSAVGLVADSHFPKVYSAIVEVEGGASEAELEKISSFDEVLSQRTPSRVAHRRADRVRKRRAKVVRAELEGGKLAVEVEAEAGAYIKELVNGDGGRTVPSFSSVLEKGCSCTSLEVVGIHDDFLRLVLG